MNEHPVGFAIALLMIGMVIYYTFKEDIERRPATEVAMLCEFVDLGGKGFDFRYDETKKMIYYSDDSIKPRDIKFEGNIITFTVDDAEKKYYNTYEYNKNTKIFRQTEASTDLKQNIGKIACITEEEGKAQISEANRIYYTLKNSVERSLKDPDSAKWGYRDISKNKVCVTVNAKNSFGGYVGNQSYCASKGKDGKWKLNI